MRTGQRYAFQGLPGGHGGGDRTVTVYDVSVTGSVTIKIEIPDWPERPDGPTLHSLAYTEALALIRDGIWQAIKS